MKLFINDRLLSMIFEENREEILINERFTYKDTSKCFTGNGFDSSRIQYVNFIRKHKEYHFMFSGFLYELLLFCKKEKIEISFLEDKRSKFPHQKEKNKNLEKYFPFEYNSHQVNALKKMLKVNNGIIKMPTGSGKGDLIIAFIKEINLPTLILVDKITLCNQLAERAIETDIKNVGIRNSKKKIDGNIMFSTIGSCKGLNLEKFKVLFIDEVHKSSSNRFQELLKNTEFSIKFGFSATPNKGDKYLWAKIRQFMGPIIYEVKAENLIKNEVIAKPKIKFLEVLCPQSFDWQSTYEKAIINNKERNKKIVDIIKKYKNEKILVLIQDVKHGQGEIIKETIEEDTNKIVEFIHGNSKNREEIIKRFDFEDIDILISTNILNEGVNIKNIRVLINASGGKSKVQQLQKIGRGTRVTENKKEIIVYDFYDIGNSFTEKHSLIREKLYRQEGFTDIEFITKI